MWACTALQDVRQPEQHRGSAFGAVSFCSTDATTASVCPGRAGRRGRARAERGGCMAQTVERFRACLHGQMNRCNHTGVATALRFELHHSPCGESSSALRAPFLCSAYVALKGIIIPI